MPRLDVLGTARRSPSSPARLPPALWAPLSLRPAEALVSSTVPGYKEVLDAPCASFLLRSTGGARGHWTRAMGASLLGSAIRLRVPSYCQMLLEELLRGGSTSLVRHHLFGAVLAVCNTGQVSCIWGKPWGRTMGPEQCCHERALRCGSTRLRYQISILCSIRQQEDFGETSLWLISSFLFSVYQELLFI